VLGAAVRLPQTVVSATQTSSSATRRSTPAHLGRLPSSPLLIVFLRPWPQLSARLEHLTPPFFAIAAAELGRPTRKRCVHSKTLIPPLRPASRSHTDHHCSSCQPTTPIAPPQYRQTVSHTPQPHLPPELRRRPAAPPTEHLASARHVARGQGGSEAP
jgi:hypothetical protein